MRRARFHLAGPRPYGCSLHTSSVADVRRALAAGYTVTRVRMLPADAERLAALVAAERES